MKTEKILRRDIIDLKYENLFAVQDDVTQRIIRALALELSPAEAAQLRAEEPANPLAYEYYLRGVDLMSNHDFPLAIEMLEKSADINPNYVLTWSYLGQSYNSTASFQVAVGTNTGGLRKRSDVHLFCSRTRSRPVFS